MKGTKGIFKCFIHDVSFDEASEYYQHEREQEHEYSGSLKCSVCDCSFDCECSVNNKKEHHTRPIKIREGKLVPETMCPGCEAKEEQRIIEKLKAEGKIKLK